MLLGTLGAWKGAWKVRGINRASKRNCRSRLRKQNGFLIPSHPLTDFKIQKYDQNEPRVNGIYLRGNLTETKDGAYIVNLDEYSDIGTHWVPLYVQNDNVTYFNSFGVEHIPNEIRAFIGRSLSVINICRVQAYDSIMCEYFCIGFIDFMLEGKTFTEFTIFSHQPTLRKIMI